MTAKLLIAAIALLHIYFLILEMFLWDKAIGLKIFKQTLEKAQHSKSLAMNMGLYNGFLAAGLIWGLYLSYEGLGSEGQAIQIFFLSCVLIAGIFGALTANKNILFIQGLPAVVALGLILTT